MNTQFSPLRTKTFADLTPTLLSSSCRILLLAACALLLASCDQHEPDFEKGSVEHIRAVTNAVDDEAIKNADQNQGDWLSYGRNYQEDRYSELAQINKENLNELGLAWTLDLATKRGLQASPLVVDGIMYFSITWSRVYAVDARKGKVIWKYDPKVPRERAVKLCCGVVNRGVALYKGSVFVGTLDGRLISLDATDGSVNWEVRTVPEDSYYSITGAPRIVKGNVLIGNGGAEYNARGFVSAYDARTGEQAWRFYTVPGDPSKPFEHPDLAKAAETWTGEWWKQGGGGTVWETIVHDPELNLVYIGTGNGTHWNRLIRSPDGGDNLYLSSIVALNADTGAYVWHYQTTPGDTWDYTATQHILLADLKIDGRERKVLMQVPKNGFFYVIDRITGEFLSGKPVDYISWATHLDEDGRPVETPNARYEDRRAHAITPGPHGVHNWHPMSYNHKTGLVYIPVARASTFYAYDPEIGHDHPEAAAGSIGGNVSLAGKLYTEVVLDGNPQAPYPGKNSGRLVAWDPVAQKEVWSVPHKLEYNGGLLSTANGLLMQGDGEGMFSIRDVSDGKVLWQYDLRSGANAPPVTYLVDGEQYITIAVGWGGSQAQYFHAVERIHPGTLYTFKLGGTAQAPKKLPALAKPITTRTTEAAPARVGNGYDLYIRYCFVCHSMPGLGGGAVPDLARSAHAIYDIYPAIVRDGAFASQGMPGFSELTIQEVDDLRDFFLYSAEALRAGTPENDFIAELARRQLLSDQEEAAMKETDNMKDAGGMEEMTK